MSSKNVSKNVISIINIKCIIIAKYIKNFVIRDMQARAMLVISSFLITKKYIFYNTNIFNKNNIIIITYTSLSHNSHNLQYYISTALFITSLIIQCKN